MGRYFIVIHARNCTPGGYAAGGKYCSKCERNLVTHRGYVDVRLRSRPAARIYKEKVRILKRILIGLRSVICCNNETTKIVTTEE